MTSHDFDQLTRRVEKLAPQEQLRLMEHIIALLRSRVDYQEEVDSLAPETVGDDEPLWAEGELEELLRPKTGLSGREIVEKHLASGAIGSWAHLGIEDGAEWVNQQKEKRKARRGKKLRWQ